MKPAAGLAEDREQEFASTMASRVRPVRVMIVDGHEIVRAGLVHLFSREPSVAVAGVATSGQETLDMLSSIRPDVVLLDYRLPDMSGAAACREILRRNPTVAVAMLTSVADDDAIGACLAAGARGYLLKDATGKDLRRAIRSVAHGEVVLDPRVTSQVVSWARIGHVPEGLLPSPEAAILALVAQGKSNREIAGQLNISIHSVKLTLRIVMRRLKANTRSEAAVIAVRKGLI